MTCARYRALISRYLDDELTPRQRAELLAHVAQCADCAAALARYRQAEVLLRKLPEGKAAPQLSNAALRKARRARRAQQRSPLWLLTAGGRIHPGLVAGLAALLAVAVAGANLFLPGLARRAIETRFGFSAPPTPTAAYLDVPASPTPPPLGPLSPPHLVATSPYDGADAVDPRAGLLLSFDQAMDRRSVERALQVSPPVAGDFQWEADNLVRFRPKPPGLLPGAGYTAAVTDGAVSVVGAPLAPNAVWSFHTRSGPSLLAVFPAAGAEGVPPTATLALTFSMAMDPASVASRLIWTPATGAGRGVAGAPSAGGPVGGQWTWSRDSRVLHVTPDAPLPPDNVQVTLDAGSRDHAGTPLPPTSWTFSVARPPDGIALDGPALEVLPATGTAPTLGYNLNADPGDPTAGGPRFALYPLSRGQLEARLPALLDPAGTGLAWPALLTAGLGTPQTWTEERRHLGQAGETFTTTLPVHMPGLYWLAADAGRGEGDGRVLALSDAGLLAWMSGGQWHTWVSRLAGGQGLGGFVVHFYDAAGVPLASGISDGQGLFSTSLPPGQVPALVLAERGSDITLAHIDAGWARQEAETGGDTLDAAVVLDRSAYHPGDAVLFSALVHVPSVGVAGVAVMVTLRDPQDRVLGSLSLQPDAWGVVSGAFTLATGLAPGRYSLVLGLQGVLHHESFSVIEAPEPPGTAGLTLALKAPSGPVYPGDLITATVQAGYGPTRPAPGLPVTVSLRALAAPDEGDGAGPTLVLTTTTGEDGAAAVALRLPAITPAAGGTTAAAPAYVLVAEGTGEGGRSAALTPLDVRPGRLALTQTLTARRFTPGTSTVLTLTVQDEAGRPVAGQPVRSALYAAALPPAGKDSVSGTALGSVTGVTGATGMATATLALPLPGVFSVRSIVTASTGSPVTAATQVWVYDPDRPAPRMYPLWPASGLALIPDQDHYRPGETARIFLVARDAGGGLMQTLLGDRVIDAQSVTFPAGGGVVAVRIPADPGRATTADIRFLRFDAGDDTPRLVTSTLMLPLVPNPDLRVDVGAGESGAPNVYAPGSSLPVRVAVQAEGASPAAGEVVLRLAPAGSEAGPAPPPLPAASGSGEAPGAARPPLLPGGTAAWSTGQALDGSGLLTTTLALPDAAGTWTLDAWAFTAAGTGHSRQTIRTGAPLDVRWAPPPVLVEGDSSTAVATITNNGPATVHVNIHLQPDGAGVLQITTAQDQSFPLEPGESRPATWVLRATMPGHGQVLLDAAWGAPGAPGPVVHRVQPVTVLAYGVADEQTQAGALTGDTNITMTLPSEVDPATAQLEIHGAPTLVATLVDGLSALVSPAAGAGRGPVDGAAARLLGTSVVEKVYSQGALDAGDLPAGLPAGLTLDLQYLYSAQHADGSWGLWPGAPADLPASTAVLEALWYAAQEAGAGVDPATVARGLDWLHAAVRAPVSPGPAGDIALPAVLAERDAPALAVLALYGQAAPGELDRLLAAEPALSAPARADLALALARAGRHDEARLFRDHLAATIAPDSADPVVLQALVEADPAGPALGAAALADRLLAARAGAGWSTPPATAAALLALSRYELTMPPVTLTGAYRVFVNGDLIREVPAGRGSSAEGLVLLVSGAHLHTGDNIVRFETEGARIYYSLRVQVVLAAGEHPIASRRAEGTTGGLLRVYTPGPITTTVALTLTLDAPVAAARLDDPLPAGLARMPGVTLVRVAGPTDAPALDPAAALIQGVENLPAGPGLRVYLGPLAAGTYRLTYAAVPVAAGNYSALPALFVSTADPTVWVRSGGDSLLLPQ